MGIECRFWSRRLMPHRERRALNCPQYATHHWSPMAPNPLVRLRKICLALPEAHEVEAWGEPTFRVKNKLFAMFAGASNHHGRGRDSVWCKAGPGNQELMIAAAPDRFFKPPYVGPSGWIGVYLDKAA